jgi:hypothetical protein
MKKLLLILTFFVLANFVNGQDKMGHGNEPEGADSAGIGTVTTWVKPSGYWTYEGICTVGYYEYDSPSQYEVGYSNVPEIEYVFGNINPSSLLIVTVSWGTGVTSPYIIVQFSNSVVLTNVYINGTTYTSLVDYYEEGMTWAGEIATNPFPAVGEECIIKLKYTLVP